MFQEKPHKCSQCSKSFPTPGDLKSHMYVHNGLWPFRCHICSRGFSKPTNLKNHMLLHLGRCSNKKIVKSISDYWPPLNARCTPSIFSINLSREKYVSIYHGYYYVCPDSETEIIPQNNITSIYVCISLLKELCATLARNTRFNLVIHSHQLLITFG